MLEQVIAVAFWTDVGLLPPSSSAASIWLIAQEAFYAAPLPRAKAIVKSRQRPGCCPSVANHSGSGEASTAQLWTR